MSYVGLQSVAGSQYWSGGGSGCGSCKSSPCQKKPQCCDKKNCKKPCCNPCDKKTKCDDKKSINPWLICGGCVAILFLIFAALFICCILWYVSRGGWGYGASLPAMQGTTQYYSSNIGSTWGFTSSSSSSAVAAASASSSSSSTAAAVATATASAPVVVGGGDYGWIYNYTYNFIISSYAYIIAFATIVIGVLYGGYNLCLGGCQRVWCWVKTLPIRRKVVPAVASVCGHAATATATAVASASASSSSTAAVNSMPVAPVTVAAPYDHSTHHQYPVMQQPGAPVQTQGPAPYFDVHY